MSLLDGRPFVLLWWFAFLVLIFPTFVSAGLFPKSSPVKMIDAKGFKSVMKLNQTSLIAFVAPWCGHCQRMAPEMSKAAIGLNPLIGTYAVDCDDESNKQLCSQQGIKGFPTVKLFPRGKYLPPMLFEQERTATSLYNFAARRVPKAVDALKNIEDVKEWVDKNKLSSTIALLLTKDKKVPLLWKALANKYVGTKKFKFGAHSDKDSEALAELTAASPSEKSKILIWIDGKGPKLYKGVSKFEPLTEFFDRLVDGDEGVEDLLVDGEANSAPSPRSEPSEVSEDTPKDKVKKKAQEKKEKAQEKPVEPTEGKSSERDTQPPTSEPKVKKEEEQNQEKLVESTEGEGSTTGSTSTRGVPPKDEL